MATDEKPAANRAETIKLDENSPSHRIPKAVYVVAALIAVGTAAFYAHTYWWSESLTLRDVNLTTDEGLISLNLPLTQLAANEKSSWGFLLYRRDPTVWTAGNAGHTPLRYWMANLDKFRADGIVLADFGYWKGSWQSQSRPGPFIVLIAPVWVVGLAIFGVYLLCRCRVIRFRLRTLFIAMTLTAGAIYLVIH